MGGSQACPSSAVTPGMFRVPSSAFPKGRAAMIFSVVGRKMVPPKISGLNSWNP